MKYLCFLLLITSGFLLSEGIDWTVACGWDVDLGLLPWAIGSCVATAVVYYLLRRGAGPSGRSSTPTTSEPGEHGP